jgi:DNA-binding NarL/FixJ family response regulator
MKISVSIVDDHQIVTDGLALILSDQEDIDITDIAHSGKQALAQLSVKRPDIILLDYNLGDENEMSGLAVAEEVIKKYPEVRVMMLTMHSKSEKIVPCINAGVHGYMLKSEKNADIGSAIRQLYRYGHYFSPEVAKDLAVSLRQRDDDINLSDRELEVLERIYKGLSTKEIADQLCISNHTVESHRKNLINKFDANNSIHLIYLALQRGILKV